MKQKLLRWSDPLIALALGVGYVALLLATVKNLGYARDEGFYFAAAQSYEAWFDLLLKMPSEALKPQVVDRYWGANHEHPALMKSLFALSHKYLYVKWRVFQEEGTSFRFAGMVVSALAVSFTYLWGQKALGRRAGLCAALLFAMMPRTFYHAHLDCFDTPVAALWLVTCYTFWRSIVVGGLLWPIVTGVMYGLLLNTKHNSWLLPGALIAHLVLTRGTLLWRDLKGGRVAAPLSLVCMALIGPVVFYALWPWIWHDTGRRLADYVQFHTGHEYYNMEFLGRTYWKPPMPRGYAWLMTLGTVPFATLLLFVIGVVLAGWHALATRFHTSRLWKLVRSPAPPDLGLTLDARNTYATTTLWMLCILVSYAPWLSTSTPIFGATKHWITAYPFMCLFAAVAYQRTERALAGRLSLAKRGLVLRACAAVLLLASIVAGSTALTLHSHPWGLSAYTPLVGGAPGAATLGLNRSFWGYTSQALLGYLNDNVPPNGSVYIHDTAMQSWDMLRRDGRVRADIRPAWNISGSDFALYHHEQHMGRVEYQIWVDYQTLRPAKIGSYDGVPVVWLYRRAPREQPR